MDIIITIISLKNDAIFKISLVNYLKKFKWL